MSSGQGAAKTQRMCTKFAYVFLWSMNHRLGENGDLKWLEACGVFDTRLEHKRFNKNHAKDYCEILYEKFGPGKQIDKKSDANSVLSGLYTFLNDERNCIETGWGKDKGGNIVGIFVNMALSSKTGVSSHTVFHCGYFALNILKIIPSNASVESMFSIYNTGKSKLRTTILQKHIKPYLVGAFDSLLTRFNKVFKVFLNLHQRLETFLNALRGHIK